MKKLLLATMFSTLAVSTSWANDLATKALSYVPNGKIIAQKSNEFDILTTNNTIVEIEFKRNGDFEEASGDNILKDTFTPDQGLVGLDVIIAEVTAQANGGILMDWSLEHNLLNGWHYEVEVLKNHVEYEYLLDATTGKIISSKID